MVIDSWRGDGRGGGGGTGQKWTNYARGGLKKKTVYRSSQRSFLLTRPFESIFSKLIKDARASVRAHVFFLFVFFFLPVLPAFIPTRRTCHAVYPTSSLTKTDKSNSLLKGDVSFYIYINKKNMKRGEKKAKAANGDG